MGQTNDQNLSDKSTLSYIPQSYKAKNSWQCGRGLKMLLWSRVRKPLGQGPAVFCWEIQANTDHAPYSQPHASAARELTVGLTEAPWESYITTPCMLSLGQ